MRVKAKEKMYYAGREYKPGEEYEMDDREHQDAHILTILGKIEKVENAPKATPPARSSQTYRTAAVQPEPETEAPEATAKAEEEERGTEEGTRRRYYRRRDLRSEP